VTRIASGLVLLAAVIGVVGFLPSWATLVLAGALLVIAVYEYFPLVERGTPLPRVVVVAATVFVALTIGYSPGAHVEVALAAAMLVVGALAVGSLQPADDVARRVAVALLPLLYLGVPVGAIVAVRDRWGAGALFALFFTTVASDTAQYYGGRLMGRRLLAPVISPKKTIEGALSGFAAGAMVLPAFGHWWLPGLPPWSLALVGVTLVAAGIVGDLFESLLKRSAGVKDASALIPGHGGVLDRVDSLLFAGPVYYVFLRFATAVLR
jgi:phosphatidate cytidylyltransferase